MCQKYPGEGRRGKIMSLSCIFPSVLALLAAPATAGAEECAGAGGSPDRGCLLWHHPGQTGPEEPAGGGRLQRRPWPGPQRAPQHNQYAAGVVSITSACLCSRVGFSLNYQFSELFTLFYPFWHFSPPGVQAARQCFVVLKSRSRGQTNTERAS